MYGSATIIYTNGVIYKKKDISIIIIITENVDRISIVVREQQILRDKLLYSYISRTFFTVFDTYSAYK